MTRTSLALISSLIEEDALVAMRGHLQIKFTYFLQKERQSRQPALHSQKQHWHSYTNVSVLTERGLLPQGESIALLLCAKVYYHKIFILSIPF
jgi:hypothetical protein